MTRGHRVVQFVRERDWPAALFELLVVALGVLLGIERDRRCPRPASALAGWRIGFAVGNARLIEALARVKSYLDYGAFTPVQAAAVAALNGPQDIVEYNRNLYRKRRDVLVDSFKRAGWDIPVPQASMFAWAPIPQRFHNLGSMEFAKKLLTDAHVAVAPGVGFGEEGEGFVRIALVENEQRLRQAARGVKKMLSA
jgi:alanine-synthesizing transaminase